MRAQGGVVMSRPAVSNQVYVVAFVGKKGIRDIFAFPSKRAAVRAKKEWDAEWQSSEEAVVYKATLERVL